MYHRHTQQRQNGRYRPLCNSMQFIFIHYYDYYDLIFLFLLYSFARIQYSHPSFLFAASMRYQASWTHTFLRSPVSPSLHSSLEKLWFKVMKNSYNMKNRTFAFICNHYILNHFYGQTDGKNTNKNHRQQYYTTSKLSRKKNLINERQMNTLQHLVDLIPNGMWCMHFSSVDRWIDSLDVIRLKYYYVCVAIGICVCWMCMIW